MNYDGYTVEELEKMLDEVIADYTQGYIHHSLYTIEFNEIHEELAKRHQVATTHCDPNKAYERAMQGI